MQLALISFRDLYPTKISTLLSSSSIILTNLVSPSYPRTKLYAIGLPTNTQLAPKARHLKISLPVLTPPSIKIGILSPTAPFMSGKMLIGADIPSNCLPPWLEIHIASQQLSAIQASLGCMIPLRTIFKFVRLRIFLMVSQFIEMSRLASSLLRSVDLFVLQRLLISSSTGKMVWEVSRVFLNALLLVPSTWASTVIASPANPYFSASLTWHTVSAQSLLMYICISRIPLPFSAAISEQDFVESVLNPKTMLFSRAILAGMSSPSGCESVFIAQGANPKGRASGVLKMVVVRSVLEELTKTLGMIMSLWKLVSFSLRVFSSSLPESMYQKAAGDILSLATSLKSAEHTHFFNYQLISNYNQASPTSKKSPRKWKEDLQILLDVIFIQIYFCSSHYTKQEYLQTQDSIQIAKANTLSAIQVPTIKSNSQIVIMNQQYLNQMQAISKQQQMEILIIASPIIDLHPLNALIKLQEIVILVLPQNRRGSTSTLNKSSQSTQAQAHRITAPQLPHPDEMLIF